MDASLDILQPVELIVFFTILVGVMVVGLLAGRKEETSEDYFLAGRGIPWWGVAGSIYGSNVSTNHLIGMLGVGFSIGFFQSHFEFGAIFGLMVLCYLFLPVYRKLGVFTLSEYLGRRYDDRSRVAYAVIMVVIMAGVQMVPGLYIGSRLICVLVGNEAIEEVEVSADPLARRIGDDAAAAPVKEIVRQVDFGWYATFVVALAVISASYTIFGGLKAVVWTDVFQSVLLLIAGIGIAFLTFSRIGGWDAMMAFEAAELRPDQKMHLYRPSNDPQLPWTGVFTGLMAMHCFYWGTNQFIVQRALGARSDEEAKLGIITAGFLKLLIPLFSIATGVAAFYLFRKEFPEQTIAPDAAFSELVKFVVPVGFGLIGLVAAGVLGALLSSIDSMMNSAATILTIDLYQKYVRPNASDKELILFGRITIVLMCIVAACLAIFVLDPNSTDNFFLQVANYQNYLTPGLLVAFFLGMFWTRGTGTAAVSAIVAGIVLSWAAEAAYNQTAGMNPTVYNVLMQSEAADVEVDDAIANMRRKDLPKPIQSLERSRIVDAIEAERPRLNAINRTFGPKLNFFHRVVFVIGLSIVVYVAVSSLSQPTEEQAGLTWTRLGGHGKNDALQLFSAFAVSLVVFAGLGFGHVYNEGFTPTMAGGVAFAWTLLMFLPGVYRRASASERPFATALVLDDRLWAGLLCGTAVFLHYFFY